MYVANKKILVTGATGGIGSELCALLAQEGAEIVFTCNSPSLLQELQESLGKKHTGVEANISKPEGRERIIDTCQQAGGIDGVINLAGILDFRLFENQSLEIIEATIQINMMAPILLCRQLIPILKQRKEGAILNVGSIFASIGHPGFAVYCASKAGVKSFTEALARELADTAIQVSYIAPRATRTALNSSRVDELNKKLGNKSDSPKYVAGEIISLLKNGNALKYLGWPEKLFVVVNGLFPGLVHKALVKNLNIIKKYANQEGAR
jgi:short-subunit dehydrogenase